MKRLILLLLLTTSAFAVPPVLQVRTTDDGKTNFTGIIMYRGTQQYILTNQGYVILGEPYTVNMPGSNRVWNGGSLIFSNSGTLDMNGLAIKNVPNPTTNQDPVTLAYYNARTNDTNGTDVFGDGVETNVTLPVWATATNFATLVITSNVFVRIRTDSSITMVNNTSNSLSMSSAITMNGATNRNNSSNVLSTDDKTIILTKTVNVDLGSNYTIRLIGWSASTTNTGDAFGRMNYLRWTGIR